MNHDKLCPERDNQGVLFCSTCDLIADVRQDERYLLASQPGMRLSARARDTSRAAVTATLPKSGSKMRLIYTLIYERGEHGLTDDEIEVLTGMTHQSASAARNNLMQRGLVTDSGQRRKNRRGLNAIVWIAVLRDRNPND